MLYSAVVKGAAKAYRPNRRRSAKASSFRCPVPTISQGVAFLSAALAPNALLLILSEERYHMWDESHHESSLKAAAGGCIYCGYL